MTNETNDKRVSDAYRDLAGETTSAEIDRKVLAMAAAEARNTRWFPRTWFRPLAWAATIALSFAFVLEMSQVDVAPTPPADADLVEAIGESPGPDDGAAKREDEARLRPELIKRSADEPAASKATIAPAPSVPEAPDAISDIAAAESLAVESLSVAPEFEMDDMSQLREAEEQARAQAGPARAAAAFVVQNEQPHRCDTEARESADTWYECIRNLSDAGQLESAQQELEALLAEFPDFREPLHLEPVEDGRE